MDLPIKYERNAYARLLEFLAGEAIAFDKSLFETIKIGDMDQKTALANAYPDYVHAFHVYCDHGIEAVIERAGDHPLALRYKERPDLRPKEA